ncbi:MAG: Crp/Fnr family transcriptional regulator [Fimbriimonas sp.]|nr:Crp/Fnr family transcriptional regulator [Fimbriimonas sp.]
MALLEVHEKPRPMEVLQSNTLLNALTASDMGALAGASRLAHVERGEMLWFKGADVDFVGLSSDGWIKMVRTSPSGTDVTIELFGPGHIFGLMGAITGTGCPLTAVAVSDLWYLRIPKEVMLDIYGSSIALKDRLIRKAALRLHGAVDLMARMSSGRVDQRIAAILFILAESYAVKDLLGIRLQCPLTRQEISEMAGTTVESTIRVMSRWQKDGIVSTDRQQIVILDETRLNRILSN